MLGSGPGDRLLLLLRWGGDARTTDAAASARLAFARSSPAGPRSTTTTVRGLQDAVIDTSPKSTLRDDATLLRLSRPTTDNPNGSTPTRRTAAVAWRVACEAVRGETSVEPRTTMFDDVTIVTVTASSMSRYCIKLAPELDAAVRSTVQAVVIDLEAVS